MGDSQSALRGTPEADKTTPLHQRPVTIIVPDAESFPKFPGLPVELQAKIYTHALERDQITPRVIKTIYNKTTNTHSYTFPIPPLMTTCRLSRGIAQIHYLLLLPDSKQPVCFDPEVDFLYCKLASDYSVRNRDDVEPVLSFINTSPLATKIRYLVLDMSYWSEQVFRMSQRPNFAAMPELHLLTRIEELFLVVPFLEDELSNTRRIYGNFYDGENGGFTKEKLERVSAALVESDRQSPNSVVPGARVYCRRTPSFVKEWALARAFGMTTFHFWGSGWRTAVDGAWQRHGRKEPGLSEIRPLSK